MDNKVLAVVNGVEIKESDLQNALMRVPANQRSYYASEMGKNQLLEQMISFELIYNSAKENEEEKEEAFLAQMEMIKKDALIQYSVQKMLSGIQISEEEIKEFYEGNKEQFKSPESVTAKHILVDTEDEAKKIAKEISEGLAFEEAATKYSKCPSKQQGGSLGNFSRGQMVPEFEEVAFSIEKGIVSEPVKTQFGYHLVKVEEKTESHIKELNEVKEFIKNKLLQDKQSEKYLKNIEALKSKYDVKLNK